MRHVFTMPHIHEHELDLVHLAHVLLRDRIEKHVAKSPKLTEAMHLVEQGDGIDHAVGRILAGWKVVGFPFWYVNESPTWREQSIPCCVARRVWALGVEGRGVERYDLEGD
jgi:hypothetical protein